MKYALIFWWISLSQPTTGATISSIGPNGVENVVGGVHQEGVRLFATAEECSAAQVEQERLHIDDVKLMSVCAPAGEVYVFKGEAR